MVVMLWVWSLLAAACAQAPFASNGFPPFQASVGPLPATFFTANGSALSPLGYSTISSTLASWLDALSPELQQQGQAIMQSCAQAACAPATQLPGALLYMSLGRNPACVSCAATLPSALSSLNQRLVALSPGGSPPSLIVQCVGGCAPTGSPTPTPTPTPTQSPSERPPVSRSAEPKPPAIGSGASPAVSGAHALHACQWALFLALTFFVITAAA